MVRCQQYIGTQVISLVGDQLCFLPRLYITRQQDRILTQGNL